MMFRYQNATKQDVWINALQVTHLVRYDEQNTYVHFVGGTKELIARPAHELAGEVESHAKHFSED